MTLATTEPITAGQVIELTMPEPFSAGWNRLDGIEVDDRQIRIDIGRYFYRYTNPTWLLCRWEDVRHDLLDAAEQTGVALEQQVLDYVVAHGRSTTDPAAALATAWHLYAYLFRDDLLGDPGLADVDPCHLRMLRELATVMSLNRVELTGEITNVGPAWFFADVAQVVFDLDDDECARLDDLYHGGFFNEPRRVESIRAHAALGGRLVHACQSAPDMSGGVVAPYGCDIARFYRELASFKAGWRAVIWVQRR